jgi:hypothetical protein
MAKKSVAGGEPGGQNTMCCGTDYISESGEWLYDSRSKCQRL